MYTTQKKSTPIYNLLIVLITFLTTTACTGKRLLTEEPIHLREMETKMGVFTEAPFVETSYLYEGCIEGYETNSKLFINYSGYEPIMIYTTDHFEHKLSVIIKTMSDQKEHPYCVKESPSIADTLSQP